MCLVEIEKAPKVTSGSILWFKLTDTLRLEFMNQCYCKCLVIYVVCVCVPSASSSLCHARHERLEHPHQLRENTQSQVQTLAVTFENIRLN